MRFLSFLGLIVFEREGIMDLDWRMFGEWGLESFGRFIVVIWGEFIIKGKF